MTSEIIISIILGVLGLVLGSFAGATVWRLRARQLEGDLSSGESVDELELKRLRPLIKPGLLHDRSRCLNCGHTLAWYDLVPVLSWVSTGGRCRYCRVPIGWFEPTIELATALIFVLSYLFWPYPLDGWHDVARLGLWLLAAVQLMILFFYDLKWFLLPDTPMRYLIATAAAMAILYLSANGWSNVWSLLGSVAILSGLYYLIWLISRGAWVGFGDVKLGLALAFILVDWRLALVALLGANLIGSLIVLPAMVIGRVRPDTKVPFGPLYIAGTMLALLFGGPVINWYLGLLI